MHLTLHSPGSFTLTASLVGVTVIRFSPVMCGMHSTSSTVCRKTGHCFSSHSHCRCLCSWGLNNNKDRKSNPCSKKPDFSNQTFYCKQLIIGIPRASIPTPLIFLFWFFFLNDVYFRTSISMGCGVTLKWPPLHSRGRMFLCNFGSMPKTHLCLICWNCFPCWIVFFSQYMSIVLSFWFDIYRFR